MVRPLDGPARVAFLRLWAISDGGSEPRLSPASEARIASATSPEELEAARRDALALEALVALRPVKGLRVALAVDALRATELDAALLETLASGRLDRHRTAAALDHIRHGLEKRGFSGETAKRALLALDCLLQGAAAVAPARLPEYVGTAERDALTSFARALHR